MIQRSQSSLPGAYRTSMKQLPFAVQTAYRNPSTERCACTIESATAKRDQQLFRATPYRSSAYLSSTWGHQRLIVRALIPSVKELSTSSPETKVRSQEASSFIQRKCLSRSWSMYAIGGFRNCRETETPSISNIVA